MNDDLARCEEIRSRTNAASAGPWEEDRGSIVGIAQGGDETGARFRTEDGRFVANARMDIPYLLGIIDNLRLAVPVEPEKHAGMENARILGHWLFENYPSSEPDIAVVALAVLKSLSAVPVEPETPERFPELPHVEAKYWAELVRARRRIAELEAQVTKGTQ